MDRERHKQSELQNQEEPIHGGNLPLSAPSPHKKQQGISESIKEDPAQNRQQSEPILQLAFLQMKERKS